MENHPIPQDVTGFQFKLIGNMTIKQFAYLVTGVVLAWVFLQLPTSILIKFPISAFFAILGISLAFFPIGGRPMDTMIGNFIKALFRPTQFIYEKSGTPLYFTDKNSYSASRQYADIAPFEKDKLKSYLTSIGDKPKNQIDEKENDFINSVASLSTNSSHFSPPPNPSPISSPYTAPQPSRIGQQPAPTPQITTQAPLTTLVPIKKMESEKTKPLLKPLENSAPPAIPDSPNMITGVTRDPRGNPLSNILVEVKDKDGNPVRAFRTNGVGRFASATPLSNGVYTVEFEDPKSQNKFEIISVDIAGQIVMPIEATSIDTREELRRSLFSPPSGGLSN
ncbi:MAG: PrgI family protein [Candidatus Levybacteria bacterium]|nr:PrgI family protein [Candidatus Levybacteria bacterium]